LAHDVVDEPRGTQKSEPTHHFHQLVELEPIESDSLFWAEAQQFNDTGVLTPSRRNDPKVDAGVLAQGYERPNRRALIVKPIHEYRSWSMLSQVRGEPVAVGCAREEP
jgi:hypothetical protein